MKLYDACDIGYHCGLDTIGECVDNICVHSLSIFEIDNITDEIQELLHEVVLHDYKNSTSVEKVLGRERMDEIDKAINDEIFSPHIIN